MLSYPVDFLLLQLLITLISSLSSTSATNIQSVLSALKKFITLTFVCSFNEQNLIYAHYELNGYSAVLIV